MRANNQRYVQVFSECSPLSGSQGVCADQSLIVQRLIYRLSAPEARKKLVYWINYKECSIFP